MEVRGIQVYGAGSSIVNGDYFIEDMLKEGYDRVWSYLYNDSKFSIVHLTVIDDEGNETGSQWCIADTTDENNLIVYYILDDIAPGMPAKEPLKFVNEEGETITPGIWRVDLANPDQVSGNHEPNMIPKLKWISDPDITVVTEDADTKYNEETKESTITRVSTYTNKRTGDRIKETNVLKETVKSYESKVIEWQATPTIALNKVYRFSFIREFKELGFIRGFDTDPTKGVYRVGEICHLHSLLKSGIDLYENLYAPLGMSKELYKFDLEHINGSMLYRLENIDDKTKFIYMPMCFFDGNPDGSIEEYNRIMLAIDLGYFADVTIVADLLEVVKHLLICKYGMDDTENVDPCQIAVSESSYMHIDEYDLIDRRREQIKNSDKSKAAATALLNKLFYSEMNGVLERNKALSSQLTAYEDALTGNKQN